MLPSPTYHITQSLGQLAGGNLYFSFQYFNIGTGDEARFTTTSSGINNIISRVTGGYASTIDGTVSLQAASGVPNFLLINPAGVTFTAHAAVDVPAAFYLTTADYVKFSDGNFYVNPTKQSTLSAAAPAAFGFLGQMRAAVDIEGAAISSGPMGTGNSQLQIAAGDVSIDGQGGQGGIFNSTGDARVIAVGALPTDVPLAGPYNSKGGTVSIENGGLIQTVGGTGSAAGAIYVSTGSLTIDGTTATGVTGLYSFAGDNGAAPVVAMQAAMSC